jgi:predicted alpha/beta-hydrolase family hydrolase
MSEPIPYRFVATERSGEVSAVLLRPDEADRLLVMAHGAGAGMRHAFMEAVAERLAQRKIATFRYQFPYMERGAKRPDVPPVSVKTVRSAVAAAQEIAGDLPILAGGKSFGGRMTSTAASKEPLDSVRGLVFFGFPLHAPGRPGRERAAHLADVTAPMLFLQGTRDKLAELDLLRAVCEELGPRATIHVVEGGDHSFRVPKRSGRTDDEALDEIADTVREWADLRPT